MNNDQDSEIEKYELKNKLSLLATNVKNILNQNQILNELINLKQEQISKNKEKLSKLYTFNSENNNERELKKEIAKEMESNNKELSLLNNSLKEQIENLKNKHISLNSIHQKENINIKNQLDLLKDRKFMYENILVEKEYKIKILRMNIDKLHNQPLEAEKEIEILSDEEGYDSEEEIEKELNNNRDILFDRCKGFNKYKKINKILKSHYSELQSKIKNLNKYINTLKNLNTNFDCINFSNHNDIYIEGEEYMEDKNNNNEDNDNPNANNESNIEESFSNETCFSETNSENEDDKTKMIINTYFGKKTKLDLKLPLTKLDLTLINYNKKKMKYDEREKTLSRDIHCDQDIFSIRINKMKNKIDKCLDKKELLIEKLKKYKKKIRKLKKSSNHINTPSISSLRIKSIKRRKFISNSSFVLTNNSLSKNKKNISSDRIDYLKNLKSFNTNRIYVNNLN